MVRPIQVPSPRNIEAKAAALVVLFQNSETVAMRNLRRGSYRRDLSPEGEAWWRLGHGRFRIDGTRRMRERPTPTAHLCSARIGSGTN